MHAFLYRLNTFKRTDDLLPVLQYFTVTPHVGYQWIDNNARYGTKDYLDYGLSIKKYPTCYATHRVIDGVLDLRRHHGVTPERVKAVRACIGVAQASMLRNHAPVTGLEAKFSLRQTVAMALTGVDTAALDAYNEAITQEIGRAHV